MAQRAGDETMRDRLRRGGFELRRGRLAVAAVAAVLVFLRVPSLVEPAQFTDEGTYADVGFALDHGAVLYRDVWDNKPPGIYWLAALINLAQTSVLAYHVIAGLLAALATAGVWFLGRRLASAQVAWAAAVAFAVLVSLPNFAGDVLNAEGFGAFLVICAVLLIIANPGSGDAARCLAAGALAALALLCKATFLADVLVLLTLPLWLAVAARRRPGRGDVTRILAAGGGLLLVCGGAAIALTVAGSTSGFIDVLLHQDLTYLQQVGLSGTVSVAPPAQAAGAALTALTVSRSLLLLVVGGAITARLARRHRGSAAVVAWWLTLDLIAVMLSARGLAQYVQQAEAPICLATALLAGGVLRRARAGGIAIAVATTVAAWLGCLGALLLPMAEAALVVPQPLGATASSDASPRVIAHYVGRGWERLLGLISPAAYSSGFGGEPQRVAEAVTVIDAHTVAGDRVFVWGRLPWVYGLSRRVPAGQYVTLNGAYQVDAAAQPRLLAELRAQPPTVLVVVDPLPAQLTAMLEQLQYHLLAPARGANLYWLAPWAR